MTNDKLELISNSLKLIAAIQEHPHCGAIFIDETLDMGHNPAEPRVQEQVRLAPTTLKQLHDAIEACEELKGTPDNGS